jgi:NRPS condensation-like uncharacterized protein
MGECSQTNIPVLNPTTAPCDGVYTPTTCLVHVPALISLGFPLGNTLLSDVISALVLSLTNQNNLITALRTQVDTLQTQVDGCCS